MENNTQSKNIEELGHKQINTATELRSKFFFHWSILSGATITLIIPLLTAMKSKGDVIQGILNIKISLILLITSLVLASLRNFFGAAGLWKSGLANLKQVEGDSEAYSKLFKKRKNLSYLQHCIEKISLLSYIFALISLYIFISKNLF